MIQLIKFKAEHVRDLIPTSAVNALCGHLRDDQLAALEKSEHSFTGLVDGKVIGCAGVIRYWEGRGEAWAIFDPAIGRRLYLEIRNIASRLFEVLPYRRIEAVVLADFAPGHRFVESLGFKKEAVCLKGYFPGGQDAVLYART
jgi:RimJ/RimL family protein N-acetyltransferase